MLAFCGVGLIHRLFHTWEAILSRLNKREIVESITMRIVTAPPPIDTLADAITFLAGAMPLFLC